MALSFTSFFTFNLLLGLYLCNRFLQVKGGAGRCGGAGGRLAVYYNRTYFIGSFLSEGGTGSREAGASGTVFVKDVAQDRRTLRVYNRKANGVSVKLDLQICLVQ